MKNKEPEYRPIWVPTELHGHIKRMAELEDRTIIAYMKRLIDRERAALRHESP